MTKATGYDDPSLNIPPTWEALMEKILRWYDSQIYPVWSPFFKHKTRRAKKANRERTYLPSVSTAWRALTPAEKALWKTAATFGTLNNYQLFTSNYCYRKRNGLSLPGIANTYHQLFGLQMSNPGGVEPMTLRRDEKDLVGPITLSFNFKIVDNQASQAQSSEWADVAAAWADTLVRWAQLIRPQWADDIITWADADSQWAGPVSLGALLTAYWFEAGENKTITENWSVEAGSHGWQTATITIGKAGQKYFHLKILFSLKYYDADIFFDRFLITDQNGDVYRESWQFKSGKEWSYDNLYRKSGWLFTPGYRVPFFDIVYLG